MSGQRWAEFVGKTALVVVLGSVGVFVAVRAAVAREGTTGAARTFVTVAGTLTGVAGPTAAITFQFQRREGTTTTPLCSPSVPTTLGAGGVFSVAVPVATPETTCPDNMFDGRNVEVCAQVNGAPVGDCSPINPVPYAHFATSAGTATRALQGLEVIQDTLDRAFITSTDSAIPNLRVSLPRAGAYLLILNGSVFGGGDGNRGELNHVELLAGTQAIARRVVPGRGVEPSTTQRSSNLTLVTAFNARGPVEVTARVFFPYPSGTIQFGGDDSCCGTTSLMAIPIAATP